MASARMTTDHEEIRRWAEERNAVPSCVVGTGNKNDPGMIRLDFPGFSGEGNLQPISWDEWFRQFDENNLGLLIQEETADGDKSNFNKLVSRDSEKAKSGSRSSSSNRSQARGTKSATESHAKPSGGSASKKTSGSKNSTNRPARSKK